MSGRMTTTVLKLGGELLEDFGAMQRMAGAIRALALEGHVVVVHGGGRAIDADLRVRGLEPRFVDGLRVTDDAALASVVSVLAGRTNTAFVGALHAAGVRAVGLTGADAGIGASEPAPPLTTTRGERVDLGRVGVPLDAPMTLLHDLVALGYVPVIASLGVDAEGHLLNVNADTFAGHVAASLRADRLLVAGGTAGVLDDGGATVPQLGIPDIDTMIASGAAHSGMVAKLAACRAALAAGVGTIAIVSGKGVTDFTRASGTEVVRRSATVVTRS
jgi:acetylglutamate kinase